MKSLINDSLCHQLNPRKIKPVLTFLLVLTFTYAASSKLFDFSGFRSSMAIQPFPRWISGTLIYLLPAAELTAVALLLRSSTEFIGYCFSLLLMVAFTGYTGLVLLHFWNDIPCSC